MSSFSKIITKIENVSAVFTGYLTLLLMMLTIIDVTGRNLFLAPLLVNVELSRLIMVLMVFLVVAATQKADSHVGIDILLARFKKNKLPVYPILVAAGLLITEIIFIYLLYFSFNFLGSSISEGETTSGPSYLIIWPFRLVLCLGLILMCVRLALQLIERIRSVRTWKGGN